MKKCEYTELMQKLENIQNELNELKSIVKMNEVYDDFHVENMGLDGVVDYLKCNFSLDEIKLPEEYNYSCLPLCLIDAIYSIGVIYTSTKNVVDKYCSKYGIERLKSTRSEKKHKISDLIRNIEEYGTDDNDYNRYAKEVLNNTQRTSSKNGVLKIQAVYECAKILDNNGIQTIEDFNRKYSDKIGEQYREVKGQSSGISLAYLKMLCGRADTIKPDRHIIRFLNKFYDEEITVDNAQKKMEEIINKLNYEYNNLSLRELDYVIWEFMRYR